MFRHFFRGAVLFLLLFLLPAPVLASGGPAAFEDPVSRCPFIAVRPLVTELGGSVDWDQENQAVDIFIHGFPPMSLDIRTGTLDGLPLEPRPYIQKGVTYVPLLSLAERFGLVVTRRDRGFTMISPAGLTVEIGYTRLQGSYTIAFSDREAKTPNFANACRAGYYLNGVVVAPGEVFSFNRAVGPRTREKGFVPGIVFSGKRQAYELGGGVCRTATLLHNAVLSAGLEVVERHRHGQPVSYVPPGRDATIYYGILDYRFRNNHSGPIRLEFLREGPKITMRIWEQE